MTILDWAKANNLNEVSDDKKANIALLAKKKKMASVMSGVPFSDPFYQELSHSFVQNKIESILAPTDIPNYTNNYETNYLIERTRWNIDKGDNHAAETTVKILTFGLFDIDKLVKPPITEYRNYDRDNVLWGIHQVFFDTDFGEYKRDDSSYVDFLRTQSKINHWSDGRRDQYLDWVFSCGLAMKCLNSDLDQQEKDLIVEFDSIEPSWVNYHAFVVKELYEVVL